MRSVLRSAFLAVCLGVAAVAAWSGPVRADDASAETAQTPDASRQAPSGKFIQDLGNKAIAIIANKNVSVEQRDNDLRNLLRDSFDLMTIGRFVIGRTWRSATPQQQQEYMRLFEALVVKTYGDRLALYTGEGFTVVNSRPEGEHDFIVNSQITHPDGSQPTMVDWRVRQRSGKLGVIDVVVEGVSLSVTQRQEYASIIQRNGGQIDGLLDMMRQRLEEPSQSAANHG